MIFGISLLAILYVIYALFVRGILWKLILFFAGWFGIRYLLITYLPSSQHIALTFAASNMTWATLVATGICILALLTSKVEG